MSKLLMSAAVAALMGAPAIAQSGDQTGADVASQTRAQGAGNQAQSQSAAAAGAQTDAARDDQHDWDTDHDWVDAAVYGENGEQIGVVNKVRLRGSGDEVRALVLDTSGFLDQGMRHIRLLGDEATVITRDALPAGWTVSRAGASGEGETADSDEDGERSWWNWGRNDDEGEDAQQAAADGASGNFTLITLDFTNDEIGMMPEYTATAAAGAMTSSAASQSEAVSEDTSGERETAQAVTERNARNARQAANDTETDDTGAGDTDTPETEVDTSVAMQSANGGEMEEEASDAYDREVRAGREDYGTDNDTGVNMQNGDRPDDVADSTLMDDEAEQSAQSDASSAEMNAGAATMDRANRGGQAGDAADADNGETTARDDQSGQAWADDESPADELTREGRMNGGDVQAQTSEGQDDATASSEDSWTEDNSLVGQDVYAQDDSRLGSVGRVQQDDEGADPIALIIVTDTMGERTVSLEDREWSQQSRDGQDALTLDYQDQGEFEQNSAPYSDDAADTSTASTADADQEYGSDAMDETDSQYAAQTAGGEDSGDTDRWTDEHAWVDVPVYSRTGEQIGEVERVRGGANGAQPTAIVLETNGFLDLGGREVELNGSNFRLTDYEGEQVLQIRYTEDEIEQMPAFNEANVSDYPLSDNPLEQDESEPTEDGTR